MNYYLEVWRKYADFKGRARRAEYWYFMLFNWIAIIVLGTIDNVITSSVFQQSGTPVSIIFYGLAVILPSIAVTVRRLHDTNHNGWWIFIKLIPIIGDIWLLVYLVRKSQPGANRFGPSPLEQTPATF